MAIIVEEAAKGNAPATGMPKTPAPTKRVIPSAPDLVTSIRRPLERGQYGQNGYVGASSTSPGETVTSDLAENLKASSDDGNSVLDQLIQHGTRALHGADDWQTRAVDPNNNVPVHSAMAKRGADSGSPGGSVPQKTGASAFDPNSIRKPGQ